MRSPSESLNQPCLDLINIDSLSSLDSLERLTTKTRLQKMQALSKRIEAVLNRFGSEPEPRVWQTGDRAGNIVWHVYDPTSNRSATFASEAEVRVWLEERYRL
ncbi:hypothetical protein HPC62_01880 [Thermoleptolyngbya sichuanensis A183]|uniref:Uncharacterized protein n=1 Tax=Thermoleptolyngbya sichuanensis A183 TaxID=2737172 RepID=A0A6M8B3Y5_9CYAN|nr:MULTISPECIES: hypothetical protein [Thermoleptolyngbya]QKD81088.1 hypothetical protein HPC62_01880 [Thermoleptolyngbya sichuanensis A183]